MRSDDCLRELAGNRALHEKPRAADACLTTVARHANGDAFGGELQVGIGANDLGRLAAKLEGNPLDRLTGNRADASPDAVEPVNEIMSTSGLRQIASPTFPSPTTMFTTPAGTPASQSNSPSRRAVPDVSSLGLTTAQQPTAKCERQLLTDDQQRIVPRRDHAHDADRLTKHQAQRSRSQLVVQIAVRVARKRCSELPQPDRTLDLAADGTHGLADLERFDQAQLIAMLVDELGDAIEDPGTVGTRQSGPGARIGGRARGLDRARRRPRASPWDNGSPVHHALDLLARCDSRSFEWNHLSANQRGVLARRRRAGDARRWAPRSGWSWGSSGADEVQATRGSWSANAGWREDYETAYYYVVKRRNGCCRRAGSVKVGHPMTRAHLVRELSGRSSFTEPASDPKCPSAANAQWRRDAQNFAGHNSMHRRFRARTVRGTPAREEVSQESSELVD